MSQRLTHYQVVKQPRVLTLAELDRRGYRYVLTDGEFRIYESPTSKLMFAVDETQVAKQVVPLTEKKIRRRNSQQKL